MSGSDPIANLVRDVAEIRKLIEEWMTNQARTDEKCNKLEERVDRIQKAEDTCRSSVAQRVTALETKVALFATVGGSIAGSIAAVVFKIF